MWRNVLQRFSYCEGCMACARGFFVPIEHPDLGIEVPYPGPPFRLEGWAPSRRPPRLGEHNAEVYRELAGLTRAELAGLAEQGVV